MKKFKDFLNESESSKLSTSIKKGGWGKQGVSFKKDKDGNNIMNLKGVGAVNNVIAIMNGYGFSDYASEKYINGTELKHSSKDVTWVVNKISDLEYEIISK